jgi:hypothetical protein
MEVLDRPKPPAAPNLPSGLEVGVDEAGARRSLRRQIAKLERELGEATASTFPHAPPTVPTRPGVGPGLLTIGELEEARDDLAVRLAAARGTAAGHAARHERNRRRVERMMLEPSRYRYARVTREDVGESGCGGWEVRPRLGLLGMLAGWWRVKISSGCPLASQHPDRRAAAADAGAIDREDPAAPGTSRI